MKEGEKKENQKENKWISKEKSEKSINSKDKEKIERSKAVRAILLLSETFDRMINNEGQSFQEQESIKKKNRE